MEKNTKPKRVIFRSNEKDFLKIKSLAEKYTGGNIGLWIRIASNNFKPINRRNIEQYIREYR